MVFSLYRVNRRLWRVSGVVGGVVVAGFGRSVLGAVLDMLETADMIR